jgi:hypothetical protein
LSSTDRSAAGSVPGTPRTQAKLEIPAGRTARRLRSTPLTGFPLSRKVLLSISAFLGITKMLYLLVLAQFWTENRFALFLELR